MLRRTIFLLLGFATAMTLSLSAATAQAEAVAPPAMDDKPLLLGDCVAVGEVRFPDGKTLVRFNCPDSGATVFVPREKVEAPRPQLPAVPPSLRPREREIPI